MDRMREWPRREIMCRIWAIAILGSLVTSIVLQGQPPAAPDSSLKPLSEVLGDWKYAKLVNLDVTDAPLKDVMKELEKQSGVHFDCFWGDKKLSLKLKDAPFWKAVAETSIRVKEPIWVYKKNEIHFASIMEYVYARYQIIGPYFVGVHWAPKMLTLKDEQTVAAIVIHAECLATEASIGRPGQPGITEATLEEEKGKPMTLKQVQVPGKQFPGRGYFVVPEEMFKKKVKLRARFDGEIFPTAHEILVPAQAGNAVEFKHFGGIKVRITKVGGESLEYKIEWDSKLRDADKQKLDEYEKRGKEALTGGKPLTKAELKEFEEWFAAKAADMRLLHAIDHVLLDKDKGAILSQGTLNLTFPGHITTEILFKKGMAPAHVRIHLAEKKTIKGLLEFEDVFSASPK
jgi:hypothetical protein